MLLSFLLLSVSDSGVGRLRYGAESAPSERADKQEVLSPLPPHRMWSKENAQRKIWDFLLCSVGILEGDRRATGHLFTQARARAY